MTNPRPAGSYDLVPKLGELRDSVLLGGVWERPELSKRDGRLSAGPGSVTDRHDAFIVEVGQSEHH
jgi:hypothetical protein